jgi:cytosine/adenosine deaminase-related metal-dependent hydrolase
VDALSVDLLVRGATLVATCDDAGTEVPGGWVAVRGGVVVEVGTGPEPEATEVLDATGCLVTPGLINTHHHLYQNLTRGLITDGTLFEWLTGLYPIWAGLDEESAYLSAWAGLAELALSGTTTSTDHLYVAPRGAGDLWAAEIRAAAEVGMRFHPTRGSMTRSVKDGGLPPDSVVQDDDEVLADSERLDVRLHTHLAEDEDEDTYCLETFGRRPVDQFEEVGWLTDRAWVAHCIFPSDAEIARLGAAGVGVAHCPSSNSVLGNTRICPVGDLRAAGVPVGLGCDGSSSNDIASLWVESRHAMLLGRVRGGPKAASARQVLTMATRDGARCLGRDGEIGQLTPGAAADLAVWPQTGPAFAGALADPVAAWLRCGPTVARHTVVAGRPVVRDGVVTAPGLDDVLVRHREAASRLQGLAR